MPEHSPGELSQAVFQTLLYSDIFDFPLTAREVQRYLPEIVASYEDVCQALRTDTRFIEKNNYFALRGRDEIVSIRQQRQSHSQKLMPYALKYGRVLGSLPFIRMVALTGSLAVMNVSTNADFDYMLVTVPGRLWTARAFALLFGRLTKRLGHTVCPNLLLSENSLAWKHHDLYSARELCQMIPITGMAVYQKLMTANRWVKDFLPNAFLAPDKPLRQEQRPVLQKFFEIALGGKFGDRFERWEMDRKTSRFSKQDGFGEETVFNAEICQGNFDHHRQWTQDELRERSTSLEVQELPVKTI